MKKILKYLLYLIIGIMVIGYFSNDEEKCSTDDKILMANIAEDEVTKYAKFEVVSTEGLFKEQIISKDTIESYMVILKSKNGFNSIVKNVFTVNFKVSGCESYNILEVIKN